MQILLLDLRQLYYRNLVQDPIKFPDYFVYWYFNSLFTAYFCNQIVIGWYLGGKRKKINFLSGLTKNLFKMFT